MKVTSIVLRIIAAVMIMILGVVLITNQNFYMSSSSTQYQYYGGDAYTGIQNAVADTSNNVRHLGDGLERAIGDAYKYTGFLLAFIGLYLLGATFMSMNRQKQSQPIAQSVNSVGTPPVEDPIVENLKKYKQLLDSGIITQEEYDEKRRQLLEI